MRCLRIVACPATLHPMARTLALALALTLTPAVGLAPALADFTEEFTLDAEELLVTNLIGEVTVVGHGGSDFVIEVEVQGQDADRDMIQFELEEGRDAILAVVFPIEDHRHFVYPRLGRRSNTTFDLRGSKRGSSWSKLFGGRGRKVEVSGSGRGPEVWADITVRVPQDRALHVLNGVGTITADDVQSDLKLELKSGPIVATRLVGDIVLDTGSGHVEAEDIEGPLLVDTGSGHVDVSNSRGGDVRIDTGSGAVMLDRCQGDFVEVDTGSGSVSLAEVECESLVVDTGSGGVKARAVGADRAEIDTGSGAVQLDLVRMGDGPYVIDTGSGRIVLNLPADASASVRAESGGGGVDVDVEDITVHRMKRDEVDFEIGRGDAQIDLDTGSGSIRISQR